MVQGVEAGGHRGSFADEPGTDLGLLAALQLVGAAVDLPLVATGGLSTGRSIAAVLAAGAAAAQLGTALMRTPEAGTSPAHRDALASAEPTALTRAFTGRTARGVVNRFMLEHSGDAPAGYPEVHHLTAPLRTAAREQGDADGFHLWAGQAHALAEELPAGELVRRLADDASAALADAARRAVARPARRLKRLDSSNMRPWGRDPRLGMPISEATAGALEQPFTSPGTHPQELPQMSRFKVLKANPRRSLAALATVLVAVGVTGASGASFTAHVGQPEQHVHGRHDDAWATRRPTRRSSPLRT